MDSKHTNLLFLGVYSQYSVSGLLIFWVSNTLCIILKSSSSFREGDKEMVKSLISKGANPSNKNCLSKALEFYHKEVVKTLINSGANLNNIFLFSASIEWKPFWQNLQLSLYSWHNLCSELKYFRKAI